MQRIVILTFEEYEELMGQIEAKRVTAAKPRGRAKPKPAGKKLKDVLAEEKPEKPKAKKKAEPAKPGKRKYVYVTDEIRADVKMYYDMGLSVKEIANTTGISGGSVLRVLHEEGKK